MAMLPYAPRSVYNPDNTIIGLIQQAGRDAAQGQRAGGAIWGNTVNGLGQIAAGTIQDIAAGKAQAAEVARKEALEAPIRQQQQRLGEMSIQKGERERAAAETEAMRAQKLSEMFSGEAPPTPNAIIGLFADDPERGFNIVKGLTAIQPDSEKKIERYRDQATLLRDAVAGVGSTPDPLKPQAWTMARNSLISRGLISEDMVPPDYSPEAFEMVANFGRAPEKAAKPESFTLSPGQVRYGADGKPIASVPKEVAKPEPQDTASADSVFVNQPAFKKLTNAGKTAVTSMNNFIQDAEKYRAKLDELTDRSGVNLTGEDAAELDSAHAALLFTAAKAFEQGALQAPDKQVVEQMIPNPAKWGSILKTVSQGGKAGQLRAMDTALSNFKARMKSTWGLSPTGTIQGSQEPLQNGARVQSPSGPKKVGKYTVEVEG